MKEFSDNPDQVCNVSYELVWQGLFAFNTRWWGRGKMSGKIRPRPLLETLSVLLSPDGGIKSCAEVSAHYRKVMRNCMNWIVGAEANAIDGQVLQETCVESHIYQDLKGFKSRSDSKLSERRAWSEKCCMDWMENSVFMVRFACLRSMNVHWPSIS